MQQPGEFVPCNLCGSTDCRELYPSTIMKSGPEIDSFRCTTSAYGLHPPIVKCNVCGLVYTNPRWDSTLIRESIATVEDPMYIEEREGRVLTFGHHLKPIEKLIGQSATRRLLDVGCHIGVMVELAQSRGWEAQGVEPSQWAAEVAQKRGLRVVAGTLGDANYPADYFDVVTLWDVVEHLTDPLTEFRHIHRVLKPNGILVVHTINIDASVARLMGKRWPWLMEQHLYYFSPHTLGKMLEKVGCEVIRSHAQGRYLRVGYLAHRLEPYSPLLARLIAKVMARLHLLNKTVSVNFGDLFTIYARKRK